MQSISQNQIRRATVYDAEAIASIQFASYQAACGEALPALVSLADSVEAFTCELARGKSFIWLVERDDEALGYVWMGESRDMDEEPNSTAEIFDIEVMPSAVGQGLGSLLLKQALAQAKRMRFNECTAWVITNNHYVRNFYEDRAFVDDSTANAQGLGDNLIERMRFRLPLN